MPRSSGGSLAISATSTMTPYPASSPSTSPISRISAPCAWMNRVLRHHRYMTPARPAAMTKSTTIGRTIRAWPVPGAIGLAVRVAPVVRSPPVAFMAPVVLIAPVDRIALPIGLASAVVCAPVARMAPVVRPSAPVLRAESRAGLAPVILVSSAGLPAVARAGAIRGIAPVSRRGRAPVPPRGNAPVSPRDGGGAGLSRGVAGSVGCAPVEGTRQELVHRRPTAGSAHSGGGSCEVCVWAAGACPAGPGRPPGQYSGWSGSGSTGACAPVCQMDGGGLAGRSRPG